MGTNFDLMSVGSGALSERTDGRKSQQSCWSRRTRLEKSLIVVVAVLFIVLVVVIVVATAHAGTYSRLLLLLLLLKLLFMQRRHWNEHKTTSPFCRAT